MGNERSGIYLALCYQTQDFLTITTIYPTRLEDEINANIQKPVGGIKKPPEN